MDLSLDFDLSPMEQSEGHQVEQQSQHLSDDFDMGLSFDTSLSDDFNITDITLNNGTDDYQIMAELPQEYFDMSITAQQFDLSCDSPQDMQQQNHTHDEPPTEEKPVNFDVISNDYLQQVCNIQKYNMYSEIYLKHDSSKQLRYLYNTCNSNDISAVNIFFTNKCAFIAAQSFLTGMSFVYLLKTDINLSILDGALQSPSIQPTTTHYSSTQSLSTQLTTTQPSSTTQSEPIQSEPIQSEKNLQVVRISVITGVLDALAMFNECKLNIHETPKGNKLVLITPDVSLTFDVVKTRETLADFSDVIFNVDWEELDVTGVLTINKAITKSRDAVYRQYICIDKNNIYSNNSVFIVDMEINKFFKNKYVLEYNMLNAIRAIPKSSKVFIGYYIMDTIKGQKRTCLNVDGIIISWNNTTASSNYIDNLSALIQKENFLSIMQLENIKEWNKIRVLSSYIPKDEKKDNIVLSFDTNIKQPNGIKIYQDSSDNYIILKGSKQNGVKFAVDLNALEIARGLTGVNSPKLYIDSTGKEKVLILKGDKLVIIRLEALSVDVRKFTLSERLAKPQSSTIQPVT